MPITVKCPACHTTIPGKFEVGEPVTCDSCGEAFQAPARPVARAAPPPAEPQPVPQPATEKGPAADFDFSRRPARKRRPPEPARNERPRRRREEPDERPRPRRRGEPSSGVPVGLIVGGVLAALFLMLLVAGGGVWYLVRQARQAEAEQRALALEEEWRAEEEQRRAAREREAWLEQLNRQQQAPNPVVPPNDSVVPPNNFVPPFNPFPPGFNGGPWPGPNRPPLATGPAVLPFAEPTNPFKPGTQDPLRALRAVTLPKLPALPKTNRPRNQPANEYTKLVYAPKRELLFALSPRSVWVYDVKAGTEVGTRAATESFTDLSLSPDQSALFVADYGGERGGYGDPINPSRVHRFDFATRKWEERKAPKIAWMIEAVDAGRVLLLERDQWVDVTLNKWEEDGVGVRELARISSDYNGDIEYDPRTGRIYHGNRGISSPRISVRGVVGDKLKALGDTGSYGSASEGGGGGTVVLSQDGSRLYYGALQVGTDNVGKNLQKMQGVIFAASRDVAFGDKAYYRASTGSKLGEFGFKTIVGDVRLGWVIAPPAITVSPDGRSVWIVDRDKNTARQFTLDGAK